MNYFSQLESKLEGRPVYKCIYQKCFLLFENLYLLKRHLSEFNHEMFEMLEKTEKCPVVGCKNDGDGIEQHIKTVHKAKAILEIFHRCVECFSVDCPQYSANSNKISALKLLNDPQTSGIFRNFLTNGILPSTNTDKGYVCRVPGCRRILKHQNGYKWHINNHVHSLDPLLDDYIDNQHADTSKSTLINYLVNKYCQNGVLTVSDVTHYTFNTFCFIGQLFFRCIKGPASEERTSVRKNIELNLNTYNGDWETYKDFYLCLKPYSPPYGPIKNILLNGASHLVEQVPTSSDFLISNTKGCVACTGSVIGRSRNIFVCIKESFNPEPLYEFKDGPSIINVYNDRFDLLHCIRMGFGYCRKIVVHESVSGLNCVALFNDGYIRTFIFNGGVTNLVRIDFPEIVDFEYSQSNNLILATDGLRLIKIIDTKVVKVSNQSSTLIHSIAITEKMGEKSTDLSIVDRGPVFRPEWDLYQSEHDIETENADEAGGENNNNLKGHLSSKRAKFIQHKKLPSKKDVAFCDAQKRQKGKSHQPNNFSQSSEENKHINETISQQETPEFLFVDSMGNFFTTDDNFENQKHRFTQLGVTAIKYEKEHQKLFIIDTFNRSTKLILGTWSNSFTQTLIEMATTQWVCVSGRVILGTPNGTVLHVQTGNKRLRMVKIFKLTAMEDCAMLSFNREEIEALTPSKFDRSVYLEEIVGLYRSIDSLVVIYRCGIMIRMDCM